MGPGSGRQRGCGDVDPRLPPDPPPAEEEEAPRPKEEDEQSPPPELFVLEIEALPLEPHETPPASPGPSEATPKAAPASPRPSEATPPPPPSAGGSDSRTLAPKAEQEEPGLDGGLCSLWTRPQTPTPLPTKRAHGSPHPTENGAGGPISSTSVNGSASPPLKRSRRDPARGR